MASVLELVKERFGTLTDIQALAIPRILNNEHTLIFAPTGSGKTESALLPVLERIDRKKGGIQALYITPLRALNRDLLGRFEWWCDKLEISHAVRHGDSTQNERAKLRDKPPHILLITGETLQAMFLGSKLKEHLGNVQYVIIDEIHDIIDTKRGTQLSLGLERLEKHIITRGGKPFQRIGISATIANEKEAEKFLCGERPCAVARAPKIRTPQISVEFIKDHAKRLERLAELSKLHKTLIFVNTRSTGEELAASLRALGAPIDIHHGSLSKEVRLDAETRFKNGELKSLISTSSLELGIDIGEIDLVVQFGSPHQCFRLLQRIGRSGHHYTKTPRGIVLTTDVDDNLEAEAIVHRAQNGWIESKSRLAGSRDVIAHQIIGYCMDKGGTVDLQEIHEVFSKSGMYGISFEELVRIALQLHSEDLVRYTELKEGLATKNLISRTLRSREYYYQHLSTIPREKKYLLREIATNKIIASLDERFVMTLEEGTAFLAKGTPWQVIDIDEEEVKVQVSFSNQIAIPEWTGEDIPVAYEVAHDVGILRGSFREVKPRADDKTMVVEIVEDILVIHLCAGTKVNEALGRAFAYRISKLMGETVRSVADPYRIMIKLPYSLSKENIEKALLQTHLPNDLFESLRNSYVVKMYFTHVGRLFGLLSIEAVVTNRLVEMLRSSIVYEETIRTLTNRFFDIERAIKLFENLKAEKRIIFDVREKLSLFGALGIERVGGKDTVGSFEPRTQLISAFKERILNTLMELTCVSCSSKQFLHLISAPEKITCVRCGQQSVAPIKKHHSKADGEEMAALVRNHGKRALIALATYGLGPRNAKTVLDKLSRNEEEFYWALIETQKNFVKNRKYWSIN